MGKQFSARTRGHVFHDFRMEPSATDEARNEIPTWGKARRGRPVKVGQE